jgi:hypothetical protein
MGVSFAVECRDWTGGAVATTADATIAIVDRLVIAGFTGDPRLNVDGAQ